VERHLEVFLLFKLTNEFSRSAVDVEGVIALLLIRLSVLKEKSVRAKFGLGDIVHALVVEVALLGVREEPVVLGALEI